MRKIVLRAIIVWLITAEVNRNMVTLLEREGAGGGVEVTVTSQIDSFRVSTLATVLA